MGFNVSYMASRFPLAKLAEIYQVELGAESTDAHLCGDDWIAEFSNGWSVWRQNTPDAFSLQALNPHMACPAGEASYTVSIAEFCMYSSFAKYTSVSKRWSVVHHGSEHQEHLKIIGNPPTVFDALRDEVFEEQQNQIVEPIIEVPIATELKTIVDNFGGSVARVGGDTDFVFDLPARLGQHFFGFRYDREPEPGSVIRCAEVLGPKGHKKTKATLWQRILGS